jgi:hypothetical protein
LKFIGFENYLDINEFYCRRKLIFMKRKICGKFIKNNKIGAGKYLKFPNSLPVSTILNI